MNAVTFSELILMLQGYFDDSGTEGQDSVVTLAGFVTDSGRWTRFSNDWDELLKIHHLPLFKMQKESKRRPTTKRDARIADFVAVIQEHVAFKIECSISVPAFQSLVQNLFICQIIKSLPTGLELTPYELTDLLGNYYFWGFHNLIASACRGIWHRGYRHPFDLFFDEQLIDGPAARKSYIVAKDVAQPKFKRMLPVEPIFKDDATFKPLQAADLFAWTARKTHNRAIAGWEWLVCQLDSIESMQCPFLDEAQLANQISGFVEYKPGTYDGRTLERWVRALRS
jgi:hypothetical protein